MKYSKGLSLFALTATSSFLLLSQMGCHQTAEPKRPADTSTRTEGDSSKASGIGTNSAVARALATSAAQHVSDAVKNAVTAGVGAFAAEIPFAMPASSSLTMRRAAPVNLSDPPPAAKIVQLAKTPAAASAPGLIVFEPSPAAGVRDSDAAFAAGCSDWLHVTVAGQPGMGQSPLLTSLSRTLVERKLHDMRLTTEKAKEVASVTGATHIATATITPGTGDSVTIAWTVCKAKSGEAVGAPLSLSGNPAAIVAGLPKVAAEMSRRCGLTSPHVPTTVDADAAILTACGRSLWAGKGMPTDADTLRMASTHSLLPAVITYGAVKGGRKPSEDPTRFLLTRLAPENGIAWGLVGYRNASGAYGFLPQLMTLRKKYPANYAFAHTQVWAERSGGTAKAERIAAIDEVKAAPANPDAWLSLAYTLREEANLIRKGRAYGSIEAGEASYLETVYPLAERAAQRATELDPIHNVAWYRLCETATFASDPGTARDAFEKALQYGSEKASVYGWGLQLFQPKWFGSQSKVAEIAQRAADDDYATVEDAADVALELRQQEFTEESDRLLQRYMSAVDEQIRQKPEDSIAHWNRATLLWHADRKPASCREYKEVVRLRPDDPTAHYSYAYALDTMGACDVAIGEYRKVLQMSPDNTAATLRLGRCLDSTGKLAEAEVYLRQAVARMPNDCDARFSLGDLYSKDKRWNDAAEQFKDTIALGGHAPQVWASAVWALCEAQKIDEAVRYGEEGVGLYSHVRQSNDGVVNLRAALGYAYLKANRYPEAIEQHKAGLELAPNNSVLLVNLGHVYYASGKRDEARKYWTKTVQDGGGDTSAVAEAKEYLAKYPANGT